MVSAEQGINIAGVVVRHGILRIEFNHFIVIGHGFMIFAQGHIRAAAVVISHCVI